MLIYLAAWTLRVLLWFVPKKRLRSLGGDKIPIDPRRIGRALTRIAWIMLCSGPYVLVDTSVKSAKVKVRVRFW